MRIAITTILLAVLVSFNFAQESKTKKQTIKGTVVAQNMSNGFQSCWHVCGLSLIVLIQESNAVKYAVVSVSYMDDRDVKEKGRHWRLVEESGRWKFKASADNQPTSILQEFAKTFSLETGEETTEKTKIQQWLPVKGSENIKLPYGQSIPVFSVDVGEFKAIK